MRNFQKRRRWRNILESWPVLIFLALLLLFFTWGVFSFMRKMQTTRENRELAEKKIAELQEAKEKLSFDIDNLNTDRGKEKVFRENCGLAKEGEGLIVVVDEKNSPTPEDAEKSGFLSFFRNWFK